MTTADVIADDVLVLRVDGGEMTFTGNEVNTAVEIAKRCANYGRSVLIAYAHRPKEKQKFFPAIIWPPRQQDVRQRSGRTRRNKKFAA